MRSTLAFAPVLLLAASLACNKAPTTSTPAAASVPAAAVPAEKPAAEAVAAPAAAEAAKTAPADGAMAKGCDANCNCTDHSKCGTGKCDGCPGQKAEAAPAADKAACGEAGAAGAEHAGCGAAAAAGCAGAAEHAGCGAEAAAATTPPAAAPAAPTGAVAHFGEAFTSADAAQPIDTVFAKPADFDGKTIKVAASVTKVCKKKGCWFVLEGNTGSGTYARVTLKDYSFFVPLDSDGKKAVVEGVFKSIEIPEAARKHLAEDGKEDPTKIQGPAFELSIVATAVDIQS